MPDNPIVLIHGYSDKGKSFSRWKGLLKEFGYDQDEIKTINTCNYATLTNEVTLKDIAEGFDRALRVQAALAKDEPFDAIVHSTGMLLIRAWLTAYPERRKRLKRLIGLAPATFGSPLAHKGRSWLGAIFKGSKVIGPDFLEAGDKVLDALELASPFTWHLAHQDMLGEDTFYGPTKSTPYVFIFCGTDGYGGLLKLVNEPGADGTVRWAGCSFTTRKISLDLTMDQTVPEAQRYKVETWTHVDSPFVPIAGLNHGTILSNPTDELVDLVGSALNVSSRAKFTQWMADAAKKTLAEQKKLDQWQQFIIRVVDERGDPIPDYNIQILTEIKGKLERVKEFDKDVHPYSGDHSLRCFHVNLSNLDPANLTTLKMQLIASSGSDLVGYHGYGSEKTDEAMLKVNKRGKWDAKIDISKLLKNEITFFYPFTTTLVEIKLNREPLPLVGRNDVCWFD